MIQDQVIVTTKADLIENISAEWNRFVAYTDALPESVWIGPADPAGWTVRDHVSHVTQWDVAVVELLRSGVPLQATLGSPDGEWHIDYYAINERIRQRHKNDSVATIKADRDATWIDVLAIINALTDEQLATSAGAQGINVDEGDQTPLLQNLVVNQGGHYAAHTEMIRVIAEGFEPQ